METVQCVCASFWPGWSQTALHPETHTARAAEAVCWCVMVCVVVCWSVVVCCAVKR